LSKRAVAIRHVAFEDLGLLEGLLVRHGFDVRYVEAGVDDLDDPAIANAELMVVLGGPIGAYEEDRYPFLTGELAVIDQRLASGRPVVGVCLGAQLMARTLGARVYPGPRKEIGFAPLQLSDAGAASCLAPFGEDGAVVLHWHGDTFDLPQGAVRLASSAITENQAFAFGDRVLGLQFHGEARHAGFERWLIGHTCEISGVVGLTPNALRAEAAHHFAALEARGVRCFERWLAGAGLL
jgi:GMP synthase (glutamine-hydrolysing)